MTNPFNSVYLISTAIANATKDKFYAEDLPSLEDVSSCKEICLLPVVDDFSSLSVRTDGLVADFDSPN
jgi:hypothetical protein